MPQSWSVQPCHSTAWLDGNPLCVCVCVYVCVCVEGEGEGGEVLEEEGEGRKERLVEKEKGMKED